MHPHEPTADDHQCRKGDPRGDYGSALGTPDELLADVGLGEGTRDLPS